MSQMQAVQDAPIVDPLAARLAAVQSWLAEDVLSLEGALAETGEGARTMAERAGRFLLERPGKRLRPLTVILANRCGPAPRRDLSLELAVSAELCHAATLLHDDVIDEGRERRGAPASRVLFGNAASVLGGDHLLIEALRRTQRVTAETGSSILLVELLDVIDAMVNSEALQLQRRGVFEPDRAAYMEIIDGKTASLFRWGLRSGGRAGGLGEDAVLALGEFGNALGEAFQLVDDVLDIAGNAWVTGKDAMRDLIEGKLTWPLILAAEANPAVEHELRAAAADPERLTNPRALHDLQQKILATGCREATLDRATELVEQGVGALARVPAGRARGDLEAIVEAWVSRVR